MVAQFEAENRGPGFVVNGTLQARTTSLLYSPYYPTAPTYPGAPVLLDDCAVCCSYGLFGKYCADASRWTVLLSIRSGVLGLVTAPLYCATYKRPAILRTMSSHRRAP